MVEEAGGSTNRIIVGAELAPFAIADASSELPSHHTLPVRWPMGNTERRSRASSRKQELHISDGCRV